VTSPGKIQQEIAIPQSSDGVLDGVDINGEQNHEVFIYLLISGGKHPIQN
jgi:hypothetical protein